MKSYSTKAGPNPMTGVLIKKKNQRYRKNIMLERCFHKPPGAERGTERSPAGVFRESKALLTS